MKQNKNFKHQKLFDDPTSFLVLVWAVCVYLPKNIQGEKKRLRCFKLILFFRFFESTYKQLPYFIHSLQTHISNISTSNHTYNSRNVVKTSKNQVNDICIYIWLVIWFVVRIQNVCACLLLLVCVFYCVYNRQFYLISFIQLKAKE